MAAGGQRPVTRMKKSWGEEKPHCRRLTGRQGPHASSRPLTVVGGRLPAAPGLEASLCPHPTPARVNPPSPSSLSLLSVSLSLSLYVSLSLLSGSVSPSLCVSLLPAFSFLRGPFPSPSTCCGWSSCVSFVPCWRLPSLELTHGRRLQPLPCTGPRPLSALVPLRPPPQSLGPIFTMHPRPAVVHVAGAVPSAETPSVTTGPVALWGIWASSGRPSGRLDCCQLLGHQQEIVSFSEHLWKLTRHPWKDGTISPWVQRRFCQCGFGACHRSSTGCHRASPAPGADVCTCVSVCVHLSVCAHTCVPVGLMWAFQTQHKSRFSSCFQGGQRC